jgi:hypothetical protein
MPSTPSVILLEFNELSPTLMSRFIAQGELPNFKKLHDQSAVYLTDAGEDPPNLEPWIQWVTVHSGVPFAQHGIYNLGDGQKLKEKCLWDVLSAAGHRVGVCGSMNVRYDASLNGYVLPDPWSTDVAPYPATLNPYFRFVQRHVQEYTNDRVPLSAADILRFGWFMLTHGLSLQTLWAVAKQLAMELGGKNRWRRAQILDKFQFDVFAWYQRTFKPQFSTFFSNSTAHLQHLYWRNMEPERFKVQPTAQEQAEFDQAILSGYQEMDGLIGRVLDLAGDHTTVIFATALSQQPCLIYEDKGGKCFYRPRDFEKLLSWVGVTAPHSVLPVMSEQFRIHFQEEHDAIQAEKVLRSIQLADRGQALFVDREGKVIMSGLRHSDSLPEDTTLRRPDGSTTSFYGLFYKIEGTKSGMHHRDGMLWIRNTHRLHFVHPEKMPLTFIAPTVLKMFGLAAPSQKPARQKKLQPVA